MPAWITPLLRPVWCCATAPSRSSTTVRRFGCRRVSSRATVSPRMPAPTTARSHSAGGWRSAWTIIRTRMEPNRRLALLRLLERAAALLRRVGLGGLVDRARAPALSALGEFTQQVGGVVLSGDTALHSHYVRQLQEKDREGATMRAFSEAVRDGAVVLDIGAHLGYFTVLAAKRGATVLAFEPNPRTIAHLRRNLALNGVTDDVRVVQRAVGGEPGTASFFLSRGGDES